MLKVICESEDLKPKVGTSGSAGLDLSVSQDFVLAPGTTINVGTGLKVQIPEGNVGLVFPRSSTGKKGLELTNTVGVIDSDYQGEIRLIIKNTSRETFMGYRGDKLFQLVVVPFLPPKPIFVTEFDKETKRGSNGFGSTTAKS